MFSARAVPGAPHKCGICALAFESIDILKVKLSFLKTE